ncbi:DUF6445 family protein [Asticcacaulis sp. MM231]|uniref:DUF6445 family protein n=1 Tax=Asticcacaulis sp. MM231 TaxID=3157666 RepID=UPI0032D56917
MHDIGNSGSRVVVIDDFLDDAHKVVEAAAALAPFPPEGATAYPGQRRQISPGDAASVYVLSALQTAAPYILKGFAAKDFAVVEASFSLLTTRPEGLRAVQRVPHVDCDDHSVLAVLHHLHDLPGTGTAFYRHIGTGLERADTGNSQRLRQALSTEAQSLDRASASYVSAYDDLYEKIFSVEARFNRLVIYQGFLLHSGYISPDFAYSDDPRKGRLTGNIFVRTQGATA